MQARKVAREIASALDDPTRFDWPTNARRWLLMLALPKRKVHVRDPARAARKTTVKELDELARQVVFARDVGCRWAEGCAGRESLQWCHCYSRRYKWLRWDLDNSFVLCAGHHLQWHHRPLEAAAWWEKELGPDKYRTLVQRAARPSKINLVAVRFYLEAEAKRLGVTI